jgi:hypothetical protein
MSLNYTKGHYTPFWDNDIFNSLSWSQKNFNDYTQQKRWEDQGYVVKSFTGCHLTVMDETFPSKFKERFSSWKGLNDVTMSLYKMETTEIMPVHFDTFSLYKKIFNLDENVDIIRTVILLKDWESGHYLEIDGDPLVGWQAGDWYTWKNQVPHMAANIGTTPRYTLQITGWQYN